MAQELSTMGCLSKGKSAERPAVTVDQVEIVCESVALNPKKEIKQSEPWSQNTISGWQSSTSGS